MRASKDVGDDEQRKLAFSLHASLDGGWDEWAHSLGWQDAMDSVSRQNDEDDGSAAEVPDAL